MAHCIHPRSSTPNATVNGMVWPSPLLKNLGIVNFSRMVATGGSRFLTEITPSTTHHHILLNARCHPGCPSLMDHPTHMISDLAAADASFSNEDARMVKHKRRFCRVTGCNSIVKSQGLCQRHGAKPRKCKADGCPKQAQGNFDGMCKSHFKAHKRLTTPIPKLDGAVPPEPEGQSVYDHVLRSSVGWIASEASPDMPLIKHLRKGFESNKPPAWHRNEERRARGLFPIHNPATQLEAFERELVWMEILLLSGVPGASFRHLARAWGRDKGFHMVLAQFICERRGNIERKKREKGLRDSHGSSDGIVGADAWDDTCYTGNAYNEALAADLLNLNSPHHHIMSGDEEDNATDSTSSHEDQLSSQEY